MIPILIQKVRDAIEIYSDEIEVFINNARNNLAPLVNNTVNPLTDDERDYIRILHLFLENIVKATPSNLITIMGVFDSIIPGKEIKKKKNEKFRNDILEALDYKGLRSKFLPKHFQYIGIKACVYCNSQITASINSTEFKPFKKKKIKIAHLSIKAKFQVDHSVPKSEYPCLSISLFNLYPVCASCNNAKRSIPVPFALYTDDIAKTKESVYEFRLTDGCVSDYMTSNDRDKIEIIFKDPSKPDRETTVEGSFQDTFDIEGIYETQKDLVEELILKATVYDASYRESLVKSFPELFTDASLSNRFFLGTYTEPEDIHKRPMTKFTQDIAKQLGLMAKLKKN